MIELVNLCKAFGHGQRRKVIADNLSVVFPRGKSVALMGRNGAGKSTLLRMVAGTLLPDSGHIRRTGPISWPIGFAGSFHADLTGAQNTRFLARIYGADADEMVDFVADFADLGHHFHLPFKSYSSGMRSRLAFGASMAIRFDTYLIDEVTSVGDAAFRKKCSDYLLDRLRKSGAVVVSHSPTLVRRICDSAMILERGQATYYEDLEEALEIHNEQMLV